MKIDVELTRFKVRAGKTGKVNEWMRFLNDNMPGVLLTLKDEKMFVETIFRETQEDSEYLYWYSVQGEGGSEVTNSNHEIDKQHLVYWEECIDEEYMPVDLKTEAVMIQESIQAEMKRGNLTDGN